MEVLERSPKVEKGPAGRSAVAEPASPEQAVEVARSPKAEQPRDVDGFALKVWLAGFLILAGCHALDLLVYWLGVR
jgi:hypothetical protein